MAMAMAMAAAELPRPRPADGPSPAAAAEVLLASLTLEEKCNVMTGLDLWCTHGVPRLGLPGLRTTDGPHGCRGFFLSGPPGGGSVAVPCEAALASSFDEALIGRVGRLLAGEARRLGANVLLGPTVNLHRLPLSGRYFECFSEDPHLSARCAVAYINGVQSQGVACVVKHFLGNELEDRRATMTAEMSDQTMRELYLPPFEAAVREARVAGIMTGYNRFRGVYCAQNKDLLQGVLRDEWGFEGFVVSDWYGNHSTAESCAAGLNLEMPGLQPLHYGARLAAAVRRGTIDESVLTARCRPMLEAMVRHSQLVGPEPEAWPEPTDPSVRDLCREAVAAGCVLLKNDGALPLEFGPADSSVAAAPAGGWIRSIAVIGASAKSSCCQGGGSARVIPPAGVMNFLEAVEARCAQQGVAVRYEVGDPWVPRYGTAACLQGCDGGGMRRVGQGYFTAAADAVISGFGSFSQSWLGDMAYPLLRKIKNGVLDRLSPASTARLAAAAALAEPSPEADDGAETPEIAAAAAAAAAADAALVFVGTDGYLESEGADQRSMRLPGRQDALVRAVARARRGRGRWAVVLNCGSPKDLRAWIDDPDVPAVLLTWFGGQEMAPAVTEVLLGDREPGGRLPCSWVRELADSAAVVHEGWPGDDPDKQDYKEGILLGYRAFGRPPGQREPAAPLFPFGFGLSYGGPFSYRDLVIKNATEVGSEAVAASSAGRSGGPRGLVAATVRLRVHNHGARNGRDVVQLYVRPVLVAGVVRPDKELRAFCKTASLGSGQEESLVFMLYAQDLAYWRGLTVEDGGAGAWSVVPGRYGLLVGASSQDLRLEAALDVDEASAAALTRSVGIRS